MNIEEHFNLLLDKYNLINYYYKYIALSMLTTILKESFYWLLIYFSEKVKNNSSMITKYAILLLGTFGLNIPIERQFNYSKTELIKEIKLSNNKYFNDRIINMSKKELLNFDLVEYFNILNHFNENLEQYIENIKKKFDIPIKCLTLVIIALNKKFSILIGLFAVFYAIVKSLNEHKLIEEQKLSKDYFKFEGIIRNYLINGKNFLINDEFNKEYLFNNFGKFEKVNKDIQILNHNLDMNVNILMFSLIIIVIWLKLHELNQFDFFYYFLIIYDIEFIGDIINEYYKTKVIYSKMQERLTYLNSFIPEFREIADKSKVKNIKISRLFNNKPNLELTKTKSLIIEENDHILLNGESGSGKTTLLYILKGIIKPNELEITPSLEIINSQTYLTLPNHKSLFSGNLYDIISNYDKNFNIELIEYSLQASKISHRLNINEFIDIETLSGGERIRLLIARIIYAVKTKKYNILLFDEIDENLNDILAIEVCKNLREIFKDNIILYVTHNEKVKELFDNKIMVKKGIIDYIKSNQ
jgi:putative ABC transport system ATP-binding protein